MSKGSPDPVTNQTVTSRTELPPWLENKAASAASWAQEMHNRGEPVYYPGQSTVGYAPQTSQAMAGIYDTATGGGPQGNQLALQQFGNLMSGGERIGGSGIGALERTAAGDYLTNGGGGFGGSGIGALQRTAAGDYLTGGGGFDNAYNAMMDRITPGLQSQWGRAGRSGSGLAQEAIAKAGADTFAGLYNTERGRQDAAAAQLAGLGSTERGRQDAAAAQLAGLYDQSMGREAQGMMLAPQMSELAYDPYRRLAQVGDVQEQKIGERIADEMARFEHNQYSPQISLDRYISRLAGVGPFGGQTNATTTPLYRNQGAGMLGGALAGAGLGSQLAGSSLLAGSAIAPWLLPFGALAGGLLGRG